jgi:hypothetical protein
MNLNLLKSLRGGNLVLSSALRGDCERVRGLSETVMRKRFILLLGVVLGSYVPTVAQTPALQIVPAQERVAPIVTMVRTVPVPFLFPSFPLSESLGKSTAHFSYLFVGAYERDQGLEGLKSLSPMREVETLFLTQSMLPLLQLWGGRLRLDGFTSTLHMQNVQLGPSAAGGLRDFRPPRQSYPGGPGGPFSVHLSGLSLSFHFGRDAQIGRPAQIWQRIARIHAAVRSL